MDGWHSRGRARGVAALLAAAAALTWLGGCSQLSRELTDQALLKAASLTSADAGTGAEFREYQDGARVQGATSLDLCFDDFPSESLRVGRNQVGIGDDEDWVSSEAVLYDSPHSAAQAMSELRDAAEGCPSGPIPAPSGDAVTWSFGDPPDRDWPDEPGILRQAYQFTITSSDEDSFSSTATYLQRGRMILALYCTPPSAPSRVVKNQPTPAHFTEVMANRLAALPEDALQKEVGAPPGSGILAAGTRGSAP